MSKHDVLPALPTPTYTIRAVSGPVTVVRHIFKQSPTDKDKAHSRREAEMRAWQLSPVERRRADYDEDEPVNYTGYRNKTPR